MTKKGSFPARRGEKNTYCANITAVTHVPADPQQTGAMEPSDLPQRSFFRDPSADQDYSEAAFLMSLLQKP